MMTFLKLRLVVNTSSCTCKWCWCWFQVDSEDITIGEDTIDITDVSNSSNVNDSFPEAANDSTNSKFKIKILFLMK